MSKLKRKFTLVVDFDRTHVFRGFFVGMPTKIEEAIQWLTQSPPKLWAAGDVLSFEEASILAKYSWSQVTRLLEKGVEVSVTSVPCTGCGQPFSKRVNRSELELLLQTLRKTPRFSCPECVERLWHEHDRNLLA